MNSIHLLNTLGQADIYLVDQFMRGRILPGFKVLDAGCGTGRNSAFLVKVGYDVSGIDLSEEAIRFIKSEGQTWGGAFDASQFLVADLSDIPFDDARFDCVLCSAVLHFAESRGHFSRMFGELARVLKPGGLLWFRMTTKHTLEHLSRHVSGDVYAIPDGSTRYLLDRPHLDDLMGEYDLEFLDPFKTVNVDDVRTMCVVALQKQH